MKQLKENKIYTEKFLIKHFIKEYREERNTNENIYSYNSYTFTEFLEKNRKRKIKQIEKKMKAKFEELHK